MALQDPQAEPSMEEILASIRRIISEEEQPPTAAEPVLDLTQHAEETVAAPDDDIVFETPVHVETVVETPPAPAPQPVRAPTPAPVVTPTVAAAPATPAEVIISPPAVSAAAGALSRLAGSLRISEQPGQTVEGVVRELIKPMLKEWLDRNLPGIVEARVEAELERIARLAR